MTDIQEFLIHQSDYLLEIVKEDIKLYHSYLKSEDSVFHSEIKSQLFNSIRIKIANVVTERLSCSYEDVLIELEELDLEKLIR